MRKDIYGKVKNGIETPEYAASRLSEWLIVIGDVCVDYDGYSTEEGLKSLIDDILAMTKLAIDGASPYIAQAIYEGCGPDGHNLDVCECARECGCPVASRSYCKECAPEW